MSRPSPSSATDAVAIPAAPPTTAGVEALAVTSPSTTTSSSTSWGTILGSTCGGAVENNRQVDTATSLNRTTEARQRMSGNPVVVPLPRLTTAELSLARSPFPDMTVLSATAAATSLTDSLTLSPRGRWRHARSDTAGAHTSREALSINTVSSNRSIACGGNRSVNPEAPQGLAPIPEMWRAASLSPLHPHSPSYNSFEHEEGSAAAPTRQLYTASPPTRAFIVAGVAWSKFMDLRLTRMSRVSSKTAEAGAPRTGRQPLCAPSSMSSPVSTSTSELCHRQNALSAVLPNAPHQPQYRQGQCLSPPTSLAPLPTAQGASVVKRCEVEAKTASGSALAALATAAPVSEVWCRPVADGRAVAYAKNSEIAGGPEEFLEITSAATTAREVDLPSASGKNRSSSAIEDAGDGRGGRACKSSPSAAVASTACQRGFFHDLRVRDDGKAGVAAAALPSSLTKLNTTPRPMNSSSCGGSDRIAHSYADEEKRGPLTGVGGANDVRSLSSPLRSSVLHAVTLSHYQHHLHAQRTPSPGNEDGHSTLWRESRCGFSTVARVLSSTDEELQEPWVADHYDSPPPSFLRTMAPAPSTAATGRLLAEGEDEDAVVPEWWADSAMGTSPAAPLHATFDGYSPPQVAISSMSSSAALERQGQVAAAALTPAATPGNDKCCFGTSVGHTVQRIPAAKYFASISQPQVTDTPQVSTSSFFARGGDITARRASVPPHASSSSPKPQSTIPTAAAPTAVSVSPLNHTPSAVPTMSLLNFASRSPTPVMNSCTTPVPSRSHPHHPMLPPQQLSPGSTSCIYRDACSGGGGGGGLGTNTTAETTSSLLLELSQLRTPPRHSVFMSAAQTSEGGHRADSTSRISISWCCGVAPPQYPSMPFTVTHPTGKCEGSEHPLSSNPNAAASASAATTTVDSVMSSNTSSAATSGRAIGGSVPHELPQRATATLALVGSCNSQYAPPASPSPLPPCSREWDGGNDGAASDCPGGAAETIVQHHHQPPAPRFTSFTRVSSDSNGHVSFGSVITESDRAAQQATPLSPPPQQQQLLRCHSSDTFPTTTAVAAWPLMATLGPTVRPRLHQRTGSSNSLLSGNASSRLASGIGGGNGSDTATSTPPPLSMAIASPGVALTLGTFSASSTFTGFGLVPSTLAAGRLSASISGRAYVHSLTASPPPRHRSVGSVSSLSSMGAFAFNDASTALMRQNGMSNPVTERAPSPTTSYSPSKRTHGQLGCKAEIVADDRVCGDEGEDCLGDGGASTYKIEKGERSRLWGINSSGNRGGVHPCGKPGWLKPGTAIEVAIQAGIHARYPSHVPLFARSGDVGGARVTNAAAAATQVGDDSVWSCNEDSVTWLSCAASFTASSTLASATYASSSFGSIPCNAAAALPCPFDVEHMKRRNAQQQQQQRESRDGGGNSLCDVSTDDEKSEDGPSPLCSLYAAAPRRYHYHRTLNAPAASGAVFQGRREKRHHRYVRVHHRRRQHLSLSNSPTTGRDVAVGEEQTHFTRLLPASTADINSTAAPPILSTDPAASERVNAREHNGRSQRPAGTASPGTFAAYSPHLSTSSLLYYDDVCSDDVDDVYYQIEKRLLPVVSEAERCRYSASQPAASHDNSEESPIDALFTVLNVQPRLNLRGGFHLSDYYAPCPVCHPAMRRATNGAASDADTSASSCSCSHCSCCCSSVGLRSTRRSASSSRAMSRSARSVLFSVAPSRPSASWFTAGLRHTTPSPPPATPVALAARQPGVSVATAKQLDGVGIANNLNSTSTSPLQQPEREARQRERRAAAAAALIRTAVNHRTTTAGEPASSTPPQQSKSTQAFLSAPGPTRTTRSAAALTADDDTEDKERDAKDSRRWTRGDGNGDPARLPSPFVLTAPPRHSRYRRQRVRHPPAALAARRRKGHHRGVGGSGALRLQYSSFMQQRLLCIRVNDKLTYIDPKSATCAARLLAGAALLAEKTKRKEAERERRHRTKGDDSAAAAVANRSAPAEAFSALPTSHLPQHAPAYRRHSRCQKSHHRHHSHGECRCCPCDPLQQPVVHQRQLPTFSRAGATPGVRGSRNRVVSADDDS
ncbi:hypothetical protein, unknown function [Leishmania braziliensis MHOM/BR/75/M2904]|uniref:Uncharacterized protein n=2 Tax=Leishmania braziliensis TaxID=5660 RepID=A4H6V0_LEIBR|nr:hypothetical protein, unknown function [Leishmania braziliensis MHOM/BR/75/M2904]CAJ2468392.1 unnamed protein product [Leishmania braziliensis]CAM37410.1 hypothetical protein, unknown function [Leishmania braziliensis MHOM/BR/75/M2904]